jgi:hypothetical protein
VTIDLHPTISLDAAEALRADEIVRRSASHERHTLQHDLKAQSVAGNKRPEFAYPVNAKPLLLPDNHVLRSVSIEGQFGTEV